MLAPGSPQGKPGASTRNRAERSTRGPTLPLQSAQHRQRPISDRIRRKTATIRLLQADGRGGLRVVTLLVLAKKSKSGRRPKLRPRTLRGWPGESRSLCRQQLFPCR
jgi:hypothetical protein